MKIPTKLKTPPEPKTMKLKHHVVYWADPMLSSVVESIEEEYDLHVGSELKYDGNIEFKNIKYTHTVPLLKWKTNIYYEILFFDWGGMLPGNDLHHHFCEEIIKEAEENTSKIYVMCSYFTKQAMQEASSEMKKRPPNVLLSVTEFLKFFKSEIKNEN